MRPADITVDDIARVLTDNPGTVFDIADRLGVNHSAYTLRATIKAMTDDYRIIADRTVTPYVFTLANTADADDTYEASRGGAW